MTDRYTKIVLTVIAAALVALTAERLVAPAEAESKSCGALDAPCAMVPVRWDANRLRMVPCDLSNGPCFIVGSIGGR